MKKILIYIGAVFTFALLPEFSLGAINTPPVPPVVLSATHPDSNAWYSKPDVTLSWIRPDGAYGFSFAFDQVPTKAPDSKLDTTVTTTKTYTGVKDGIWYFHIKARAKSASVGFSPITNYVVRIDTVPPQSLDLSLAGNDNANNASANPVITFKAQDATSGIDHYEVILDGKVVAQKAVSPYKFQDIRHSGAHMVQVAAVDSAGNRQTAELKIQTHASMGFSASLLLICFWAGIFFLLVAVGFQWSFFRPKKNQGLTVKAPKPEKELVISKARVVKTKTKPRRRIVKKITKAPRSPRKKKDKILEE